MCKQSTIQLLIDGTVVFETTIDCGCEEDEEKLSDFTHDYLANFTHELLTNYIHG